MKYIPVRSRKHPGAVFIKCVDTDVGEDAFVCKVYAGNESIAEYILDALNARIVTRCEVCKGVLSPEEIMDGKTFHQACYDSELAGPMEETL